ncbi:MAG: SDR family NAD(P)-dependent oxidoreductase, partial [Acidobacteriota bacterium]
PEDGIANVAAIGDANESTQGNSELRKAENQSDWFYLPVWQPQSPSLQSTAPDLGDPELSWLLFLDAEGIGLHLAERLEEEGHEVVLVAAGQRFEKVEDGAYTLDPTAPGAYVELLADLHAEGRNVTRVLHLWTSGNATSEPSRATELGLLSLTYLTQAWSAHPTEDRRQLWVLSTHLHQITGTDEVRPEKATVLGACAVIPKEYAGTACRSVEIALPTGRLARRRLIERLRHELELADETGPVAWRGNRRWIREFEPVAIDEAPDATPAHLRPRGVYVITGGLGGVGLTLAEELARAVQARLVLVGRSPFPAANEWPQWLTEHPLSDPVSRQIRQLERCQSHGAEILVLAADVTDADAIDSVRQRTLERFGAVHGVIHAAGVPPGGLLEIKTREQLEAVLAPKVRGSRVVAEAFADEDLDFLILCSSLTALTGAFGLVDHTAANACLDAFAQAASTAGSTPVVAINWDAWLDVGQAAAAAEEFGLTSASDDGDSDDGRGEVLRIPDHPLFDACLAEADGKVVYRARLDPTEHWVLDEHRLQSFGVMPATGHLEMVRAAWADHQGDGAVELRQVTFLAPLAIPNGEQREVRVVFAPRDAAVGDGADFTLESRTAEGAQTRHVEGRVLTAEPSAPVPCDLATLRQTLSDRRELPQRSAASEEAPDAFHFGPRWRGLEHDLRWGEAQGLISLHLAPEFAGELDTYHLHPALLDAATAFIQGQDQRTYLPIGYDRLLLRRPLPAVVHSHARLAEEAVADAEAIAGDLVLYDDDGAPVAEIEGFTLRRIDPAAVTAAPATEAAAELVGILPREGAEVFRRLLAMPELPTQILVSTRHFPTLLQASATAAPESHVQYRVDHLHDRSGGTYPRPQLAVQFVAPRDALEEELAVVWRDLLALSEVGAHDSFFDLGGDSLLATRLIGLIRERFDIHLPLRAIFEAPSLAKLALTLREHVADEDDAGANGAGANGTPKSHRESVAEQPLIQGPVPLTPNQMSFFEDYPRNPHRWNVTSLFEVRGGFSTHALRVALGALLYHHDALRSRFFRNGEGWRQEIASPNGAVPFSTADLSALPEDRKRFALEAASELLQASLHLSRGPVLRLVLFDLGGQAYRLLVIGHHLAMDNVSFQIVLEDLQAAYLQALRGEAVRLAPKGSSLKAWSEHLQHHALSAEIEEELGFWLRLPWSAVRGLPFDYPGGENSALSARTVHSELSRQDGERLQHQLPRRHDVTVEEILITALVQALARWTGETLQLLSLSHHSRNPLFPDLDISRTVGWFSSTYPALLELDGDPAPAAALQSIAEQLRRLPHKGLSHQILRFLGRDPQSIRQMHALPQPSVAFTYRKLQAADGEGDSMFRLAPEFPGEFVDLSVARPALIYIFASHTPRDGRLELSWNYSNNCHQRATIERLATLFEDAVGSLV